MLSRANSTMRIAENVVFLSLGTNLGNRPEHMERMLCLVRDLLGSPLKHSPVMETSAVDVDSEIPAFLNCVVSGIFDGAPYELLNACLDIERRCGRVRGPGIISRRADVDILLFGNRVVHERDLRIPHPAIPRRKFCMEGVAAIAPGFIHPEEEVPFSKMVLDMSESVRTQSVRVVKESDYPLLESCLSEFE